MNKYLIIVAHPDDETLFFSGLLQSSPQYTYKVICVTNGNADGMGEKRAKQFSDACHKQGALFEQWDFPDIYENRLDQVQLQAKLKELTPCSKIYTHGIIGEYGHPHHQDVSFAVHKVFGDKTYSIAHNCYPDEILNLTEEQFKLKEEILSTIYLSETIRFSNIVPANFSEGYTKIGFEEVEAIYHFVTGQSSLDESKLKHYFWIREHLKEVFGTSFKRMF